MNQILQKILVDYFIIDFIQKITFWYILNISIYKKVDKVSDYSQIHIQLIFSKNILPVI